MPVIATSAPTATMLATTVFLRCSAEACVNGMPRRSRPCRLSSGSTSPESYTRSPPGRVSLAYFSYAASRMPWPPDPEKRISTRELRPLVSAMVGLLCLLPHAGERGDELGALAVMQQAHGVLLAQARDALLELARRHGVLLLAAQELRGIGGQVEAP